MADWKIIDEHGDDVMTAEAVAAFAKMEHSTPRHVAQREARQRRNDVDAPVFAVKA